MYISTVHMAIGYVLDHYSAEMQDEEQRLKNIRLQNNNRRHSETNVSWWLKGHTGGRFHNESFDLESLDLQMQNSFKWKTIRPASCSPELQSGIGGRRRIQRSNSMHPSDNSVVSVRKAQIRHSAEMQEKSRKLSAVVHNLYPT